MSRSRITFAGRRVLNSNGIPRTTFVSVAPGSARNADRSILSVDVFSAIVLIYMLMVFKHSLITQRLELLRNPIR